MNDKPEAEQPTNSEWARKVKAAAERNKHKPKWLRELGAHRAQKARRFNKEGAKQP